MLECRTFDRLPEFDERSRLYPARQLMRPQAIRPKMWRCTPKLDQGAEGACVGHAWAHEVAAHPYPQTIRPHLAFELYHRAQQLDEWPGEDYSGTSVLAGAKAVLERGGLLEYRWAFTAEEVFQAVAQIGPVVLGIPWYEGMYRPGADGFVRITGQVIGGHAILARGVKSASTLVLRNSWGAGWGRDGDCYLSRPALERLLREQGEACVPVRRARLT